MSVDAIYQKLRDATTDGVLDLPPAAFGTGDLSTALAAYLLGDLRLTKTTLTKGTNDVTAAGTGAVAPLTGMHVAAVFADSARGVEVRLTATGDEGWTLADAFPLLGQTFVALLPFADGRFVLTSDPTGPGGQGLTFSGTAQLAAEYGPLAWLVNGVTSLDLTGPVTLHEGAPVFTLSAPVAGSLTVGVFSNLSITFVLRSTATSWTPPGGGPAVWAAIPGMGVGAAVTVAGVDTSIFIDLSDPHGMVPITLDVTGLTNLGLAELGSLVHGASLGGALPPSSDFDPGETFDVVAVTFLVDPARRGADALAFVQLELATGPGVSWTLAPNLVLGGITLTFGVAEPFGAAAVGVAISGTITWPEGSLTATARAPDVMAGIALAEGSRISLGGMLAQLLPTKVEGGLYLDELDVVAFPLRGQYSLVTGVTGDWTVDLGVTHATLLGAWVQLDYDRSATPATTGTVAARAQVGDLTLDGSWTLPHDFRLVATLDSVDLTHLAEQVVQAGPPSGVPHITLDACTVAISARSVTASTVYDFAVSATASSGGTALGGAYFEVQTGGTGGAGFVAGFAVPATWSPGDLFPALASLFGGLTFSDTGVLVSSISTDRTTLPNLTMPSLPAKIAPGFTAFTTLTLAGDGVGLLAELFATDVTLSLLAVVDLANPVNSEIKATLGAMQPHGAVTFTGLVIDLKPGAGTYALTGGALLHLGDETLTIAGTGAVTVGTASSVSLDLVVSDWAEPFGISGLYVKSFGLGITVSGAGTVQLDFLGHFLVREGSDPVRFDVGGAIDDFTAPSAVIFGLAAGQTLWLADLIGQFTGLDLSHVPVLSHVGFKTIEFAVVVDPAGFTIGTEHFPPGIRVNADVTIYDWVAVVRLTVNTANGVYASGSIDRPIAYGDVFRIADATGTAGPHVLVDTTSYVPAAAPRATGAKPYLVLSASVALLGVLNAAIDLSVTASTFDFDLDFAFAGATAVLRAHFSAESHSLAAAATIGFTLDVSLPALVVDEVEIVPPVEIKGVAASLGTALAIGLVPTPTGAFTLRLTATLPGTDVDVGFSVTLAQVEDELANLWREVRKWLTSHVREVWSGALASLESFVDAIRAGLFHFGGGAAAIAKSAWTWFSSLSLTDLAAALRALGFGFTDVVNAVVAATGAAYEAVLAAVEDAFGQGDCAMTSASGLLAGAAPRPVRGGPPPRALVELGRTERGQRLLFHYHLHEPELRRLTARHPDVRAAVTALTGADGGAVAGVLGVLDALEAAGSPELRESVTRVRGELRQHAHTGWADLVAAFEERR